MHQSQLTDYQALVQSNVKQLQNTTIQLSYNKINKDV